MISHEYMGSHYLKGEGEFITEQKKIKAEKKKRKKRKKEPFMTRASGMYGFCGGFAFNSIVLNGGMINVFVWGIFISFPLPAPQLVF
jgi:hypothetical protein